MKRASIAEFKKRIADLEAEFWKAEGERDHARRECDEAQATLKMLNRQYADQSLELRAEQSARKNTERRLEALLDKHIGLRP